MFAERDAFEPPFQFRDRQIHQVDDAASAHFHVAGFGAESRSVTLRAHRLSAISGQHDAVLNLVLSLAQILEEGVDGHQSPFLFLGSQTSLFVGQIVGEGAVPEPVLLLAAELEVGFVDGKSTFGIEADEPFFPFAHLLAAPAHDRALIDRQCRVRHHQVLVDAYDAPKALALRAGPGWGVEGKEFVGRFLEGDAVGLESHAEGMQDAGRIEA